MKAPQKKRRPVALPALPAATRRRLARLAWLAARGLITVAEARRQARSAA